MNIVKRFYLCYLGNRRRTENNNDETEVKIFYSKNAILLVGQFRFTSML